MHLALLWLALQSAPMVQSVRSVVQYLAPITVRPEQPIQPVSVAVPLPEPKLKAVTEMAPPAPHVIRPKAIELPPEKPVELKLQPVLPPPLPPPRVERVQPEPPAPVAAPAPTPQPAPVQLAPRPVPAPVAPVEVPVEQVPIPAPTAVPVPLPEPTPTPVPVPTPAPAPAPAATLAPARPAAITPVESASGSGAPQAPSRAVPAGSAGSQAPLNLYPYSMKNAPRQRSLAEITNEQINGTGQRDRLSETMSGAAKPDCIGPNASGSLLSAITIPIAAAMDKCK
jgi:hypothetical protein